LRTLVYRYFFAGWLFDGASTAARPLADDLDARGQQLRQADWLPTYVLRWFFCAGVLCLAGIAAEHLPVATAVSLLLYTASIACMGYAMFLASTWVRLRSAAP
jgi:hypothetical protein